MLAVKVHSGNAHVKGKARNYAYFIAQVFKPVARKADGVVTWRATGIISGPFRSERKAEEMGRILAQDHEATFIEGFGSLHGVEVGQRLLVTRFTGESPFAGNLLKKS